MLNMRNLLFVIAVLLSCSWSLSRLVQASDVAKIYPAPDREPLSPRFKLSVATNDVPVYIARIVALTAKQRESMGPITFADTSDTAFSSFDFAGDVGVSVTCPEPIQSVKLLPTSAGITPQIVGGKVVFTITKPGQLTLEVNGDWIHSLHLFANPPEADAPRPDDPSVFYFGPGVHEVESVKVGSGKTVYIAGGAVIYHKMGARGYGGPMFQLYGSNITLRGRGIIDGSRIPGRGRSLIETRGSNITVEGVVLRDCGGWNFPVKASDHVTIKNLKIFGWRGNSDGIDICNSRNVDVSDCFFRTWDDLVVIKTPDKSAGPSRDISVKHCVLWNELAHALSLGAELRAPVENVTFSDCDVIHDKGREWDLRVYNCDSGAVRNIVFDNIRIEESRRLFSLWIGKAIWSAEAERGHIDDVIFRNVVSAVPSRPGVTSEFKGFDAEHAIHDVQIDHVLVGGQPFKADDLKDNEFVQGVAIRP
jgi:hypothetical protein